MSSDRLYERRTVKIHRHRLLRFNPSFVGNLILIMALGVVFITGVIAVFTLPRILSTNSATDAIDRGVDLQACQVAYIADSDQAIADAIATDVQMSKSVLEGLKAVQEGDDVKLQAVLLEANTHVVQAEERIFALRVASERRTRAAQLAIDNPDQLIELGCDLDGVEDTDTGG